MLILPIVNRGRILNVEIRLKNTEKIKSGVNLEEAGESDVLVDGIQYSNSIFNVKDASENLVVDFIRHNSKSDDNFLVTTREANDSTLYDVYSVSMPPKKVNKQLDDLYGSVVTDMRKEIPGSSKGRYLSFEKLGIDKNLSDDKISMLQDIVKNVPDEDKWPVLFKGAGISDLIETIDFVNTFDCRVISDTTIPEDSITDTLEIFKKLNTKDYKNISNYYNIALGNKKIYNKLLYINKLVYNKPLDLIKSGKNKNKVLVKNNREELDYERGKKST